MKALARIAGHLIDAEDLAVLGKGVILLCLGAGAVLALAVTAGMAWRVFHIVGG